MRNNSFTLLVFEANILEDTPDSLDVTFGRSRGRLAGPPLVACSSCERASGGNLSASLPGFAASATSTPVILS